MEQRCCCGCSLLQTIPVLLLLLVLRWAAFDQAPPTLAVAWWISCWMSLIQVFVKFTQLLLYPLQYDQLSSGCCHLI